MYVAPEFEKEAFSCPYCQAFTTQTWFKLVGTGSGYAALPTKLSAAVCFSCKRMSCWLGDKMVIPTSAPVPMPYDDMPEEPKNVFLEARQIFTASPRGAAALLRLAIQMIMKEVGQPGKSIDTDIGALAKEGKLKAETIKMLHTVRITGNESVHPGEINLNDDTELASALFYLTNLIVYDLFSYQKFVDSMWERMPEAKRKTAEERDLS